MGIVRSAAHKHTAKSQHSHGMFSGSRIKAPWQKALSNKLRRQQETGSKRQWCCTHHHLACQTAGSRIQTQCRETSRAVMETAQSKRMKAKKHASKTGKTTPQNTQTRNIHTPRTVAAEEKAYCSMYSRKAQEKQAVKTSRQSSCTSE